MTIGDNTQNTHREGKGKRKGEDGRRGVETQERVEKQRTLTKTPLTNTTTDPTSKHSCIPDLLD
jgi:ribosomal protein L19E